MNDPKLKAIERTLLDYMSKCDDVKEASEDVAEWWKTVGTVDDDIDKVTFVLEDMLERKLIKKVKMRHDIFIYKIV